MNRTNVFQPPGEYLDAPSNGTSEWKPDRLSQQANAERLVHDLAGIARFNVSRGDWMIYDAGRFIVDETGAVIRVAKRVARHTWALVADVPDCADHKSAFKHAIDSEKAAGIAAMLKLAQSESGISVPAKDFDRDGHLFNVLNCTVNLRLGNPQPHCRADLLSKLAPVIFDRAATCPLFDRFMDRIMDGNEEKIAYLQRIAGVSLAAEQTLQELFIFWGGGANGKSVFLDTLIGLLGDYAGTAPESLLTVRSHGQEHPTEIADLCGKRLVVASETEEGAKLRVQLVKRLTGDMVIKGRFMRQDFFEFPRTHKLILVSNNKPRIVENTNAVWRRVRLVPFTVTIPPEERDTHLLEKLKAEWPGILNWCIAGYLDFQASGMQTPAEVLIATEEYQTEQDLLTEFLAEKCIRAESAVVGRNEIYSAYQAWAKSVGDADAMERNAFYERLRRVSGVGETSRRIGGKPSRVWTGIGLANLSTQYQQATEGAGGVTP